VHDRNEVHPVEDVLLEIDTGGDLDQFQACGAESEDAASVT